MKFGKTQLHLGHLISVFMAFVIGLSFSYVGISTYTRLLEAKGLDILTYLSGGTATVDVSCPQLKEVAPFAGTRILKDECSGTYWYSMDLPILNLNDQFVGYTWQQAKDSCENLAKVTLPGSTAEVNVFRLPTVDELLALANIPCEGSSGCSPITRSGDTITRSGDTLSGASTTLITPSLGYFYLKQSKALGNGSYWAVNDLNASTAASVNLQVGTVNNPAIGKSVQLNVRCIYNTPGSLNVGNMTDPGDQVFWQAGTAAGKFKIAYRSNIQNATLASCPAPFNTSNSVNTQCTGVSSDTDKNIIFSCSGTFKPYRRQVCSNDAATECVSNAACSGGGTCVFDVNQPIGCKNPSVCSAGFTYYEYEFPNTLGVCENDLGRDCRLAQSPSDCITGRCIVSNGICSNNPSQICQVNTDCGAGNTCKPQGECIDEKRHICQPPTSSAPAPVRVLDLEADHVVYNPYDGYGQEWLTSTTVPTIAFATGTSTTTPAWFPADDWSTEYIFDASNQSAKDCRFKGKFPYYYDTVLGKGINERDWTCTNLPAHAVWNVWSCSNDQSKVCTTATQEADCGTGNICVDRLGKYHQNYDGSQWSPADSTATYNKGEPSADTCAFRSDDLDAWAWDGSQMAPTSRTFMCASLKDKPSNSAWWNSEASYPQNWNFTPLPDPITGSTGAYSPATTVTAYSSSGANNVCDYHCSPDSIASVSCTKPANSGYTGTGVISYSLNTSTCAFTTNTDCAWTCNSFYDPGNGNKSNTCYQTPLYAETPSWNGHPVACNATSANAYCTKAYDLTAGGGFYTDDFLDGANCHVIAPNRPTGTYTVASGSTLADVTLNGSDSVLTLVQCQHP